MQQNLFVFLYPLLMSIFIAVSLLHCRFFISCKIQYDNSYFCLKFSDRDSRRSSHDNIFDSDDDSGDDSRMQMNWAYDWWNEHKNILINCIQNLELRIDHFLTLIFCYRHLIMDLTNGHQGNSSQSVIMLILTSNGLKLNLFINFVYIFFKFKIWTLNL